MTDIAKLRDAVVEAAMVLANGRRVEALGGESVRLDDHDRAYTRLDKAVSALRAAEEAARKPRLMRAEDAARRCWEHGDATSEALRAITARDSEWMKAIRKLPSQDVGKQFDREDRRAVLLSDIEALAETAK